MKKIFKITISILCIVLMLCACSKPNNNTAVNPLTDCTADEIVSALGLKIISLDATNMYKIAGDIDIYSLDVERNGTLFNIRLAKSDTDADISGVHLDDKVSQAIYDSADAAIAPSMSVATDKKYSVAYCNWNGYSFSVSTDKSISLDEMQGIAVNFAKELISTENIVQ